jgi:signal transduction histidine kinase
MRQRKKPARRKKWNRVVALNAIGEPGQLLAAFSSTPSVGVTIYDPELRIQFINQALAERTSLPLQAHLGKTIREIVGDATAQVEAASRKVFATGKPLSNVEIREKLPARDEVGYWVASFFPLLDSAGQVRQVGAVTVDITKQKKLEESLHALSGGLIRIRDEEQRRLAHELHDSINQHHVALKMNLGRLTRSKALPKDVARLVKESVQLLDECMAQTRTISYLLHPPLLDEAGLLSALRWYAAGFQRRSGIKVKLEVSPGLERLPEEIETAAFRIVQECLSNVQRHSGSATATVRVRREENDLRVEVEDQGRGMPTSGPSKVGAATIIMGVGLAGMRERVKHLNGQLEIHSCTDGSRVSVLLPLSGGGAGRGVRRVTPSWS